MNLSEALPSTVLAIQSVRRTHNAQLCHCRMSLSCLFGCQKNYLAQYNRAKWSAGVRCVSDWAISLFTFSDEDESDVISDAAISWCNAALILLIMFQADVVWEGEEHTAKSENWTKALKWNHCSLCVCVCVCLYRCVSECLCAWVSVCVWQEDGW